jgi:hypothetical protein
MLTLHKECIFGVHLQQQFMREHVGVHITTLHIVLSLVDMPSLKQLQRQEPNANYGNEHNMSRQVHPCQVCKAGHPNGTCAMHSLTPIGL